jgi:hypothetical protein
MANGRQRADGSCRCRFAGGKMREKEQATQTNTVTTTDYLQKGINYGQV